MQQAWFVGATARLSITFFLLSLKFADVLNRCQPFEVVLRHCRHVRVGANKAWQYGQPFHLFFGLVKAVQAAHVIIHK